MGEYKNGKNRACILEFITYLILLTLLSYYTIIVRGQNNDFKE